MVLVVGGAGYIGSHMVRLLRERGVPHAVYDNFEEGYREAVAGSDIIEGDLRNPTDLDRALSGGRFDTVMHFAAYIEVGQSVREPARFYENNLIGVKNLVDAMVRYKTKRLVFSSTAAIFGNPVYTPIDEDHPKDPTSPYGDTKLAVERMLAAYDAAYGLKTVCLRYFNACGAWPDGSLGESHRVESHLIPLVLFAAMGKRPDIRVFGSDYPTPDGTCVRDYVHVVDLADAHLRALERLRGGGGSRAYNLGNGQGYSVREVIEVVRKVTGRPITVTEAPRRPGDPAVLVASSVRARGELGWSPAYPDLETIVGHAWAWHQGHPDGYA
ncbi:MAG: UDP-glucose 4-epimerase GalE [Fimbriimonadaceae bacterium]|nr:UDP-glucose 4-epimerase GalE [Fimbriimonadaceae bacterium]